VEVGAGESSPRPTSPGMITDGCLLLLWPLVVSAALYS
jgi:hypothetical protein